VHVGGVDVVKSVRQETAYMLAALVNATLTKRPGQGRHGLDRCLPGHIFVSSIGHGQVDGDARRADRLEDTKQHSGHEKLVVVLDESGTDGDGGPADHRCGDWRLATAFVASLTHYASRDNLEQNRVY
jgi:hypothetical protein